VSSRISSALPAASVTGSVLPLPSRSVASASSPSSSALPLSSASGAHAFCSTVSERRFRQRATRQTSLRVAVTTVTSSGQKIAS
jgi:hypothetical protein